MMAADIVALLVGGRYIQGCRYHMSDCWQQISQAYHLGEDIPGLLSWRRYPRPTVLEKISQAIVLEKISQAYHLGEDITGLPLYSKYIMLLSVRQIS